MRTVTPPAKAGGGLIVEGEALEMLRAVPTGCAGLVYADPPFNTGATRRGGRVRTVADPDGTRRGFAGATYRGQRVDGPAYADAFDDYLGWLRPLLEESRRVLAPHGSLYLHVDPRESHYCKVLLDEVFGRACFLNEVIWAYDFGARTTRRWPSKHDVILVYARTASAHHFDLTDVDRIPYMAPSLQTAERAARGKTPTDVWWQTIVPTNSAERTGYPTQKPVAILRRIIAASSRSEDLVLDWCAGSGTTGVAAQQLGRRFLLCDSSPEAVAVMRRRCGDGVPVRVLPPAPAASPAGARAMSSPAPYDPSVSAFSDYMAAVDPPRRALLEHIRDVVTEVAPAVEQGWSYQMPTLTLGGKGVLGLLAAKNHLSVFPFSAQVVDEVRDSLPGFSMSRGTIRFTVEKPIPDDVVRAIVRRRLDQIAARG